MSVSKITSLDLSARQRDVANKLAETLGGMVWWKVGKGKTRIAIAWFVRLCELQSVPRGYCIVVCRRKSFNDWKDEIKLILPNVDVWREDAPVLPMQDRHNFLLVSEGKLATLQISHLPIKAVVIDEGWLFANYQSERSKAVRELTKSSPSLILSGTMMKARDSSELYAQAMAVHKHTLCSLNATAFRSEFQLRQVGPGGFPTYYPKAGAKAKIIQRFLPVCDIYFPESDKQIIEQFHNVESTPQQLELFKQLKETFSITLKDTEHEYKNTLSTIIKAQQIANGWFQDKEERIHYIDTNKIEKLSDELSSIVNARERCIVWCAFRHDVKMLANILPFETVQMLGGKEFDVNRWNDPDVRICLATEASGSAVNHFAQTTYAIYYSANFKWKDMQQSRGRTERESSMHSVCHYKYLQVDGSLDKHVYKTALDSGNAEQAIVQMHNSLKNWLEQKL